MGFLNFLFNEFFNKNNYFNLNLSLNKVKKEKETFKLIITIFEILTECFLYFIAIIFDEIIMIPIKISLFFITIPFKIITGKGKYYFLKNYSDIIVLVLIIINIWIIRIFDYAKMYHLVKGQNLKIILIHHLSIFLLDFLLNLRNKIAYPNINENNFNKFIKKFTLYIILNIFIILIFLLQMICVNLVINSNWDNLFVILVTTQFKIIRSYFKKINFNKLVIFFLNTSKYLFLNFIYIIIITWMDKYKPYYNTFLFNIFLFFSVYIIFTILSFLLIIYKNKFNYNDFNNVLNELRNKLYYSLYWKSLDDNFFNIDEKSYLFLNLNLSKDNYFLLRRKENLKFKNNYQILSSILRFPYYNISCLIINFNFKTFFLKHNYLKIFIFIVILKFYISANIYLRIRKSNFYFLYKLNKNSSKNNNKNKLKYNKKNKLN